MINLIYYMRFVLAVLSLKIFLWIDFTAISVNGIRTITDFF